MRKVPATFAELEEELCDYCDCSEEYKGVHLGPNGPYGCFGSHCEKAFENFLEDQVVTCECCSRDVLRDECEVSKDDCHEFFICEECLEAAE